MTLLPSNVSEKLYIVHLLNSNTPSFTCWYRYEHVAVKKEKLEKAYRMGYGGHFPFDDGPVLGFQIGWTLAPMIRNVRHKQLVEGVKPARDAGRKTDQPNQ